MEQIRTRLNDTPEAVADLVRVALAGERRLQRLERMFRWTVALFLLTLALSLYALSQAFGATDARAQSGWPHAAPIPVPQVVAPARRETATEPEHLAQAFRDRVRRLKAEIAGLEDGELNVGHALAVILHDTRDVLHEVREMLAVMPAMGEDMHSMRGDMGRIAATMDSMDGKMTGVPVMAEEMRRLNVNIDIMTTSIDSTMGRMGRMMPYMW